MTKVLLCDDSNIILSILDKRLSLHGFTILGKAKDGEEGFKLYKELKPELVLLDITMPNRDGKECLADILSFDKSACVIMVSALSDQAVSEECLKLGAKAFISKAHLSSTNDFEAHVLSVIRPLIKTAA